MQLGAADLVGADDLVVVDEEDRRLRRLDELVHLRDVGALRLRREAAGAGVAQPVRLVQDEDVDVVGIGVAELVEVAELRLAGTAADDAAHVLGEGLAAGGVLAL